MVGFLLDVTLALLKRFACLGLRLHVNSLCCKTVNKKDMTRIGTEGQRGQCPKSADIIFFLTLFTLT